MEAPDDYRNNIKIDVIVSYCEECGGEIYLYDEYYKTDEGSIHEECFLEFAEGFLHAELVQGFEGLIDYD